MIRVPTTFVIGAGASVPYGLPTGSELMAQARALDVHSSDVIPVLREATGADYNQIEAFLRSLRRHRRPSIDAFLETRLGNDLDQKLGRATLAALMNKAIQSARARGHQVSPQENWFGYLFERMSSGARTARQFLTENQSVRFVTFNFDSILEEELSNAVTDTYGDTAEVSTVCDELPAPIHVHGLLPPAARLDADWLQEGRSESGLFQMHSTAPLFSEF